MIARIRECNTVQSSTAVRISVEVEKTRSELMDLLPLADVVCEIVNTLNTVLDALFLCRYLLAKIWQSFMTVQIK